MNETNDELKNLPPNQDASQTSTQITPVIQSPKSIEQLINISSFPELMNVLTTIVKGKKFLNIDKPEDALAALIKTRELGIPFMNGLDHLTNINGKLGVDFYIIAALISKPGTGIWWEVKENGRIVYNYVGGTPPTIYCNDEDEPMPSNYQVVPTGVSATIVKGILDNGMTPVYKIPNVVMSYPVGTPPTNVAYINRKSVVVFHRKKYLPDGSVITIDNEGSFTTREAYEAGILTKTDGSTLALDKPWFKYAANQTYVRAFTQGARRIGSDFLMGLYEKSELYDANKVDYRATEEGTVEIIEN